METITSCVELVGYHSNAQSAEQRRSPDSYGKSGQGETLQACRSGSPHAPWKAGDRSGTERSKPSFTPQLKKDVDSL
ncbi:hypothetical protein [Rossellomorea marisflavi]|uniref:hypothetical protein n=1 Tax=Rossellomorea marisflavi TaxID=189381 RepID=UPI00345DD6D4